MFEKVLSFNYEPQVRLLLEILPLVMMDQRFALKGGTAINLFIRDMPRLSVDIDLAYLPIETREDTILHMNAMLQKIAIDIQKKIKGSKVIPSKSFDSKKELKLLVESNGAMVKVEPNYILRGSVFPTTARPLAPLCSSKFGASISTQVMSLEDVYGGKICAALDRQHPRDLFDIKILLDHEGITQDIKIAFLVYLMSHSRPMSELLAPNFKDISQVYRHQFSGMTEKLVSLEELIETRKQLPQKLQEVLTDENRKFLLDFKQGKADWSTFEVPHIQNFPAIQWKLKNIAQLNPSKLKESLFKLEQVLNLK